jgi:perosamine synthetase
MPPLLRGQAFCYQHTLVRRSSGLQQSASGRIAGRNLRVHGPNSDDRIPVYRPYLSGNERKYVLEALDSGWISSRGAFIGRFEAACASCIGISAEQVTSVCNGTVALHLALLACGVGAGDEVIVPTFTYVASVNAIRYVSATPVFVDSLADTWQVDPADIVRKITPRTRAIMAVHLYGCPCDMDALAEIARAHNLLLIEDAAEAFGSLWKGKHVGVTADVATFSFFGNKTITTGEGGLVIFKDKAMAREGAMLKSQYASQTKRYWHDQIGYNFRMTNLAAAIGLAQIEKIDEILDRKRRLAAQYQARMRDLPLVFQPEPAGARHSYWMVSALLPKGTDREAFFEHLEMKGVETRPLFYPAHVLPMYEAYSQGSQAYPVAVDLGARGFNLPSFPELTDSQIDHVASAIRSWFA